MSSKAGQFIAKWSPVRVSSQRQSSRSPGASPLGEVPMGRLSKNQKKNRALVNLKSQLKEIREKNERLENENQTLKEQKNSADMEKLSAELEILKECIQDETRARIHAENQLKVKTQEAKLQEKLHKNEVAEMQAKREGEIENLKKTFEQEWKPKLEHLDVKMEKLQEEYEGHLKASKEEQDRLHAAKIAELGAKVKQLHSRLAAKQVEISALRLRLGDALQDLYRYEQQRQAGTQDRATKKRKLDEERESEVNYDTHAVAYGDVELVEDCLEGKYIRLKNNGDKQVNLAGWTLTRKAGELTTSIEFHPRMKLDSEVVATIWSADAEGKVNDPPFNIAMTDQKWWSSDHILTTLSNNNGKEMARRETRLIQRSHSRKPSGLGEAEEIFHEAEDGEETQEDC